MSYRRRVRTAAVASLALGGVLLATVAIRAASTATNPDPDSAALGQSFETPSWPLALVLIALPLLFLACNVITTTATRPVRSTREGSPVVAGGRGRRVGRRAGWRGARRVALPAA